MNSIISELNDCEDYAKYFPGSPSGVYKIVLPESKEIKQVWCDMETDGGNWTVMIVMIQKHSKIQNLLIAIFQHQNKSNTPYTKFTHCRLHMQLFLHAGVP